jgi:polygalacturonase
LDSTTDIGTSGTFMNNGLTRRSFLSTLSTGLLLLRTRQAPAILPQTAFNIADFGAKGDGITLDSTAINHAITAAADAGGGVIDLPAGRYLCFTLHLRSHITLRFSPGAIIIAATPNLELSPTQYDPPEPQSQTAQPYQDFGHNHWHNSLLWGEDLDGVSIVGPGEIWGRGLEKGDGPPEQHPSAGNKVIALKRCRNVRLRDFTIRQAGHFGVLATAVDNLAIEDLHIDTQRDGIDIDCCRDVHVHACSVNTPWDDAIVLKSSYALGETRSTERVTISDCTVTGSYKLGSTLDGAGQPVPEGAAGEWPAHVGRIKIGTETVGDIRNIVVTNCIFEGCHGLAVISEDGGAIEDCSFSNITMRNNIGPPIFVRLGGRNREPAPSRPSAIRRISFADIDCVQLDDTAIDEHSGLACSSITGIPGHLVEDITITNLRVRHPGSGTLRTKPVPEALANYPEPKMFGPTPSHGLYLRHAARLDLRDILVDPAIADARPLVTLEDVHSARLSNVRCSGNACTPASEKVTQTACSDITIL